MSKNESSRKLGIVSKLVFLSAALFILTVPAKSQSAAEPKVHTVNIKSFEFLPASLTVRVGDTIVWKNDDVVPHTATSTGKKVFDSGNIEPGASWSYVVKKKGTFPYFCAYHINMKAKLIVR